MVELALVMKGVSLGLSVAKYTGIIQDHLELKIEQLAGSELEAGLRALQQAANSEHEHQSLLREARGRFNKAISLEKDYRLAAAHLGLALCHAGLGEAVNAAQAISDLVQVQPPNPSLLLKAGQVVNIPAVNRMSWGSLVVSAFLPPGGPLGALPIAIAKVAGPEAEKRLAQHEEAVAHLVELQQEAKLLLEQSLRDGCDSVFGLTKREPV